MAKIEVSPMVYSEDTYRVLGRCGCLLVSGNIGKANVMTIGGALIGRMWGKYFFLVAIRPSKYTHRFIEETGEFTVNVPKRGMEETVKYCGSVSGREHDKFRERKLTLAQGKKINAPIISDCVIHYECKVAYKTEVNPKDLQKDIAASRYPSGDYSTLYFGEILATYVDEDAREQLPSE